MRLTLRTLLAYLDDTLPPSEARELGTKLAESEPAQEIVERIKNVIRRRRLTVPPAASRIDANTIAEYLDNEITSEQAEELERICLSSDVHLAEVAACHQILSLVLGEPAAAPDEAVKRMYALGKGDKGKAHKHAVRAGAPREKPASLDRDGDETLRMGLPSVFAKNRANRAMIFTVAGLACLLLVVGVMQLMKKPDGVIDKPTDGEQVAKIDVPKKIDEPEPTKVVPMPKAEPTPIKQPDPKEEPKVTQPPEKDPKVVVPEDLPPPAFGSVPDAKLAEVLANITFKAPSAKVLPVGQLLEPAKGQVAVVLQQVPKTNDWKRLAGKNVDAMTVRPLVSLPGSKAAIVTAKGVKVTLWGNIPEHVPMPPVQESMAEFHDHGELDLDMTLRRGRVLIENLRDDPIVVRVRFENSSEPGAPESYWLLTLSGPKAEAMIDRWSFLLPGEPRFKLKDDPLRKGPIAQMACVALAGTVFLKTPTEAATLQPTPSANLVWWSGMSKKLVTESPTEIPWLDPKFVTPPEIIKIRGEINNAFTGKAVDVAIAELLKSTDAPTRRTAVRCLGAIDDVPGLLDMMNQEKSDQRRAAVETLRGWIAHSRDNDYKVYDAVRERYKENDAELFMTLLHGFSQQALNRPETYELLIERLKHNEMAIRELAAWNLYLVVPTAKTIAYDAAMDSTLRERAYQQWLKLIPPGKLPPAAPKAKA